MSTSESSARPASTGAVVRPVPGRARSGNRHATERLPAKSPGGVVVRGRPESALAVGEVRGEEAAVLYEAMRVGAGGSAVLGTIHGDGGEDVRERVVSDLDVPASSFATTDLVVTMGTFDDDGERGRRVAAIEEVVDHGGEPGFEALYRLDEGRLQSTDRLERGNSELLAALTDSDESYADVRERLSTRATAIRERDRQPTRQARGV